MPAHRYPEVDETTWTILAHGGSGYNYYMLYGGTNFETWNDNELAASYDYAARSDRQETCARCTTG